MKYYQLIHLVYIADCGDTETSAAHINLKAHMHALHITAVTVIVVALLLVLHIFNHLLSNCMLSGSVYANRPIHSTVLFLSPRIF